VNWIRGEIMRKSKARGAGGGVLRGSETIALPDLESRPGRVGGAQVAFGAPGPRIDLDRVLETWRDGSTVSGSARIAPAPPNTVSLPDGTTISFTVAGATIGADG
jgi:hypothetical protein